MYLNLWDTTKAVLGGKFMVLSAYIKQVLSSQINHLMMYLEVLEKHEQMNQTQKCMGNDNKKQS